MSNRRMVTLLHRPWVVWFALCIALVGALVPTVSHALAWSQGGSPAYGAICTTTTTAGLADADGKGDPSESGGRQGSLASLDHCAFCLHASERCAPPPAPALFAVVPQGPGRVWVGQRLQATISSNYSHAAPRGPPTFS